MALAQAFSIASVPYSLLVLVGLAGVFHLASVYWRLRHIPGPFWAKFTNLQRIFWVKSERAHEIHQVAHARYGDVVTFGPNMVSLADPAWIKTIYPMRPGFPKVTCSGWPN